MWGLGLPLLGCAVSWRQGGDVLQEVLESLGEGTARRAARAFCLLNRRRSRARSVLGEVLEGVVEVVLWRTKGTETVAFFPNLSSYASESAESSAGLGGVACIEQSRTGAIATVCLVGADLADRVLKASEAADGLDFLSLPDLLKALVAEVSEGRDQIHARVDLAVASDDDASTACATDRAVGGGGSGFELFGERRIAFSHEMVEVGEFVGLDLHGERVAFAVVGCADFEVDDKASVELGGKCARGDELAEVFLHLEVFDFGLYSDASEVSESFDGFLPRTCDLGDGVVGRGFSGIKGDGSGVNSGLFEFLGAFEIAGGSRGKEGDDEAVMACVLDDLVDIGSE